MEKIIALLFLSTLAFANTPPAGSVISRTYSGDGTLQIGGTTVGGSIGLYEYNINPTTTPVNTQTIVSGAAVDPRQIRSLNSVGDSVTANLGTLNGAATAANQSTEITALGTINTTLGSPFQAGGSIGNTSFAATQATAANLNATVVTTGGTTIAKDSSLTTINSTLGSPMQNSGGSVTANAGTNLNTSALALESGGNLAGIKTNQTNGTQQTEINNGANIAAVKAASTSAVVGDPALVVAISPNNTPVLPNGAATAANQSTEITALGTINTTLGSPFQAGGSIGNTSFAATQGTAANLNATVVTTGGVTIAKDSSLTTINSTLGSPMQNSGGSVTANAGTNLNTSALALESGGHLASIDTKVATAANQTAVQGALGGGTAATNSLAVGGLYNSTLPTLTNGQQASFQLDSSGRILVSSVSEQTTSGTITTTCSTPTAACPAGSYVAISLNSAGSAQVLVGGTFSGASMNVDGSSDGSTWVALGTATGYSGLYSTSAFSSTGKYRVLRVAGLTQIRVRAASLSSGSVSIFLDTGIPVGTVEAVQQNAANFLTTSYANDGSGNPIGSTSISSVNYLDVKAASSATTGAAVPSYATQIGGSDGTNLQAIGVQNSTTNPPANSYFIQTVPMTYSYKNLTGAATTTVKSGAGTLHEFCVNNDSASSTATIYDNTAGSGTIIATLTSNTGAGGVTSIVNCTLHDVSFTTGLTVVTTGATANFTAVYK